MPTPRPLLGDPPRISTDHRGQSPRGHALESVHSLTERYHVWSACLQALERALGVLAPGVASLGRLAGSSAESTTQAGVIDQPHDGTCQRLGVVWWHEQRRVLVAEDIRDLAYGAGDDRPTRRHVLEQLGRRAKELATVRLAPVRRDQDVAGGEIRGHLRVREHARPDNSLAQAVLFDHL